MACAIEGKQLDSVKFLVSKGASISGVGAVGAAALKNDLSLVQYLISAGAPVEDHCSTITYEPIGVAIDNNNESMVHTLLEAGAHAHCTLKVSEYSGFYETPLSKSAKKEKPNLNIVNDLIDHGALLNYADETVALSEPIRYAILGDHLDLVNLLLNRGAYLPRNSICDLNNSYNIAELLLEHGESAKNICTKGNSTIYGKRSADIVKLLIANGANVNVVNKDDETALELDATMESYTDIKKLLIDSGIDMNILSHQRAFFW